MGEHEAFELLDIGTVYDWTLCCTRRHGLFVAARQAQTKKTPFIDLMCVGFD